MTRRSAAQDAGSGDWPGYLAERARTARYPPLARFYGASAPSPETPISQVPLMAMDMETTGLDESRHAIVSIGVVPFSLQRIRLADRRYWVVHPPRDLIPESITLHHITHADIENAPDLVTLLPELLDAMAGRIVVVHYRNIERPFLNAAVRARIGESLHFPVIDTMELEARRYRLSFKARFRKWLGRPPVSVRLGDSRTRYGLPPYEAHQALLDALAAAELLQAQISKGFGPDTPLGELWC